MRKGDHTRVGMVTGEKTPERLPVLFVTSPSCPEPSGVTFVPPVETYQHRGEARQAPRTPLQVYVHLWVRQFLG